MSKVCQDSYSTTFNSYSLMHDYHQIQEKETHWVHCQVNKIKIEPLTVSSTLYGDLSAFAKETSEEAVEDTANNLGLAIRVDGNLYPVRDTAYKSLLDRAKISGTVLPKLSREVLALVLNECLNMYSANSLILVRNEMVSAVHSGDAVDYSVLPIDKLLETLQKKLNERFPGNVFEGGYTDHSITSATWKFPNQKDDLLEAYSNLLVTHGKGSTASKMVPGIRFITSDTGIASAKVSALLMGGQYPIHIGGCVSVDHRHQSKIEDFEKVLDQLFAQYQKSIESLQKLLEINLDYPINAMTRVCKKLSLPKKAAVEAIAMYEMAYGGGPATAHDVFMAMQEIPFILKTQKTPESKMLVVEENMARALFINWSDYDLAKAVSY